MDASFEVVGLETGVYWRHNLTGEERANTIRSRKGRDENRFSIDVLEILGMVMRTFVMRAIR